MRMYRCLFLRHQSNPSQREPCAIRYAITPYGPKQGWVERQRNLPLPSSIRIPEHAAVTAQSCARFSRYQMVPIQVLKSTASLAVSMKSRLRCLNSPDTSSGTTPVDPVAISPQGGWAQRIPQT
jgi:hypothetical protein